MEAGPGLTIPGYDDFVEIGRGGFAVVYRARQTRLRRLVAVKVLTSADTSEASLHRFEQECAAIGTLSGHRNVVAVHDAGATADGRPYLVMEYLPAGSLADRVGAGPMPADETLAIGAQLADALGAAHDAEVLHRDVKPANVMLDEDGTPKLADFGIAVVADAHQTATGVVMGTMLHSAPEVIQGQRATVATDVYSLASTLYTLVRGRPAFAGEHDEGVAPVLYRAVHEPVPDLRPLGVPGSVADLLEQGMSKDPAARFSSSAAFRRAIEGTTEDLSDTASLPILPAPVPSTDDAPASPHQRSPSHPHRRSPSRPPRPSPVRPIRRRPPTRSAGSSPGSPSSTRPASGPPGPGS